MLTWSSMVPTEMKVTTAHGNCFLKGIQFSVWGAGHSLVPEPEGLT